MPALRGLIQRDDLAIGNAYPHPNPLPRGESRAKPPPALPGRERTPLQPGAKIGRRQFLANAGWAAMLLGAGSAIAALLRFLDPRVVTPAPGAVEVGLPDEYAVGTLTFVEQARAYLGRDEGGLFAITAVCTYLGCTPRLEAGGFVCPCHGSRLTSEGAVVSGPATRPLDRAFVGRAADGHLPIDRSRVVGPTYRLPL